MVCACFAHLSSARVLQINRRPFHGRETLRNTGDDEGVCVWWRDFYYNLRWIPAGTVSVKNAGRFWSPEVDGACEMALVIMPSLRGVGI